MSKRCHSCGNDLPEGAAFCPMCGAAVPAESEAVEEAGGVDEEVGDAAETGGVDAAGGEAAGVPQQQETQRQPGQQGAEQQWAASQQPEQQQAEQQPASQQAGQRAYQQSPQSSYQQPYRQQPQQATYTRGCLSAGLDDLRASRGWIKKSCFLALLNCVPILDFVAFGYGLNWAREVPFGGRTQLPAKVVTGKNFEIGFYAFLISLVCSLVNAVVGGILGLVPLVGLLASVAVVCFFGMFQTLLSVRMAMMQQLGEGVKVGKAWDALKRNWTSLLCAAVVPYCIAVFVALLVVGVISLNFVGLQIGYSVYDDLGSHVFGMGMPELGLIIAILLLLYLMGIMQAIAQLIAYRAVAHWVGRYAPEWTTEAYQNTGWSVPGA